VRATIWRSGKKHHAWERTTLNSALNKAATKGSACVASSVLPDDIVQASGRRPAVISLWQLASYVNAVGCASSGLRQSASLMVCMQRLLRRSCMRAQGDPVWLHALLRSLLP